MLKLGLKSKLPKPTFTKRPCVIRSWGQGVQECAEVAHTGRGHSAREGRKGWRGKNQSYLVICKLQFGETAPVRWSLTRLWLRGAWQLSLPQGYRVMSNLAHGPSSPDPLSALCTTFFIGALEKKAWWYSLLLPIKNLFYIKCTNKHATTDQNKKEDATGSQKLLLCLSSYTLCHPRSK